MSSWSGAASGYGAAAPRSRNSIDLVTRLGLVVTVVVLFSISGGMLWLVGYNYDGLFGSPATKIHPSTYLIVLLFAWRSCTFGNPVGYCVSVADKRPATALMAVISIVLLFVVILRQRPGMAGMIDTFVAAALFVLMLSEGDEKTFTRLQTAIHAVMTANALLGLFEFATKTLLFPYRLDGVAFVTDLRSSALQGHPLSNATLTSVYVLALLSGSRSLSAPMRLGLIGLQCAALVAFGGRSAMVVTIVLGGCYLLFHGLRTLRKGRISLLGAALAFMLAALLPVALVVAASLGFFDALAERFVSDGGSANARVEMFEIFKYLELRDVIVGPSVDFVSSLRRINGLEQGIENPIISMTVYHGAAFTLLMLFGFGLFMYEVARRCHPGVWLPMMGWLMLLNTSESLASKSTILSKFVVLCLVLYRPARTLFTPVSRPASSGQAPR
ncbi:VpsF family polysaccharide biosynthesis protein [Mesorhizobium sp. INR15]|uniref:VpsF family polysaccharide biosynthesis protein n=1 Tax=Mesorhizobium sp. INR15 TaxID=2654248 RepID=UPI001AED3FDA|nr:VpsF family polysaccharide biosynthesis protein [Mesorhizobium sp. INR15]